MIKVGSVVRGLLVLVGSLLVASMAFGQNNTFPVSGNTGIGTTSPASLLHVKNVTGGGSADTRIEADNITSVSYYAGGVLIGRLNYQGGNTAGNRFFGFQNLVGDYLRFDAGTTPMFFVTNGVSRIMVAAGGNVGIGTTSPGSALSVVGDIAATGNVAAKYQDVAEWVPAREQLQYGTVVVLDSSTSNQVISSTHKYDTAVAGVVSVKPGLILGEAGDDKLMIATSGRVKVRVDATRRPVHVGDLLVTSDVEGLAMVSEPLKVAGVKMHRPGTIIGKALQPLDSGRGEILVLLTLQ